MSRVRAGKLVFRDPVLLCGAVYLLLYFDASGFLRLGLLAAILHELGHIFVYCIQQRHLPVIEVTMTGFCMRTAGLLHPSQRFFQFGIKHRVLHKQSVFCVLFILPQMCRFCNRFRRVVCTFRIFAARAPLHTPPSVHHPAAGLAKG